MGPSAVKAAPEPEPATHHSISRDPDGADTDDNDTDFCESLTTPGEANVCYDPINTWHIPNSYEACSYNASMRNPEDPSDPAGAVCIYTGVYPIGDADSMTLYYSVNGGAWNTHGFEWECNDSSNDYWWTFCDGSGWFPGATYTDTVDYYIEVVKSGMTTMYLYSETSPDSTDVEAYAQVDPFTFTYRKW